MITNDDLIELNKILPKTDKGNLNKMIYIYNKYNTPTLDGCTCSSQYRLTARKTVLNWYNELITENNGN